MKQEIIEEIEFCHYSGLPSPTAYKESKQVYRSSTTTVLASETKSKDRDSSITNGNPNLSINIM